jgi:transcriptional regulator with XRE-family HTH domain
MGKTLQQKIAQLPKTQQARVRAKTQKLIEEELNLRQLRATLNLTQTQLAEALGVGQDEVSRAERRADMLISTLRHTVEAMGGTLDIVAHLPGHPPAHITQFRDVLNTDAPRKAKA